MFFHLFASPELQRVFFYVCAELTILIRNLSVIVPTNVIYSVQHYNADGAVADNDSDELLIACSHMEIALDLMLAG